MLSTASNSAWRVAYETCLRDLGLYSSEALQQHLQLTFLVAFVMLLPSATTIPSLTNTQLQDDLRASIQGGFCLKMQTSQGYVSIPDRHLLLLESQFSL